MAYPQISLEEEYGKNTGISPEDIAKFRNWLDTQPHLPGNYITDLDLILTLHCCERSTEVSKKVLDLHFTLRTLFHNLFKNRILDENRIKNAMDTVLILPLSERTVEGYAVLYTHLVDNDPKNFVYADCMRAALTVIDCWQHKEGSWPGFVMAVDMADVTLSHLSKLDLQTLQQFFFYLQEAMLVKLKHLIFLNAPSWMDRLMMMLKPFMKKSLLDQLQIHQIGADSVKAVLPVRALPKEEGGEYKTLREYQESVSEMLKTYEIYIKEENQKRVDEARRPGKPKNISDIFGGVEGSFKKLDID